MLKIDYDVPSEDVKKNCSYHKERKAVCDFLESKHKNIRFEYATVQEAKSAAHSLRCWNNYNGKPLAFARRENFVFAIKDIKEEE